MNAAKPATRRITANLPRQKLEAARQVTGRSITETLVEGLDLVRARGVSQKIDALRGTFTLDVDLDEIRGRRRRR